MNINLINGLFVIIPDKKQCYHIDKLREQYAKDAHYYFGAHITLTQPFNKIPNDDDFALIENTINSYGEIKIDIGPINSFLPYPVIYYEINPKDEIIKLRNILHKLNIFNLALPHTNDYIPHCTIAEKNDYPKVDNNLLNELSNYKYNDQFICDKISYIALNNKNNRLEIKKEINIKHVQQAAGAVK